MILEVIKKSECDPFDYQRYKFQSRQLQTSVNYGVLRFKESFSIPIKSTLYLLHGGNGDDSQFMDVQFYKLFSPSMIERMQKMGLQIVFPFIGTSFLHEHPTQASKSFSSYFFNELIPEVEKISETKSSSRYVGGISMGGHAALNAFFRCPEEFAGVGAHFPTLTTFNFFNSSEVKSFSDRVQIQQPYFDILISGYKNEFIHLDDYQRHDPIALVKVMNLGQLRGKKIYFDVGSQDEFGLYEGAQALSKLLTEKDIPHQFELVLNGKHDAAFIAQRLPKMIEYLF